MLNVCTLDGSGGGEGEDGVEEVGGGFGVGDVGDGEAAPAVVLADAHAARVLLEELDHAAEHGRFVVGTVVVADEIYEHRTLLEYYFLYAEPAGHAPQPGNAQEFFGLVGYLAEAVDEAHTVGLEVCLAFDAVEFLIKLMRSLSCGT